MDENGGGQQHQITDMENLPQRCGNMSLHGTNVPVSDRLESIENLASSFRESTSRQERLQNLSDPKPNLLQDLQNLTGSPCTSSREFQSPRNTDTLFSPRGYRNSFLGQENSFQEQFPTSMRNRHCRQSRLFNEPYHFNSRYMSSPRRGPYHDITTPTTPWISHGDRGDNTPKKTDSSVKNYNNDTGKGDSKKPEKEKKSITTKTFAHGMMDVSLLTSNSTQLRAVLSNPDHEYYTFLLWLIGLSIVLQISSAVLLILSDYFKTQVKEKDLENQKKRKLLNFLSLALVSIVTSLNVLISAFSTPSYPQHISQQGFKVDVPVFSSADIPWGQNHTEL